MEGAGMEYLEALLKAANLAREAILQRLGDREAGAVVEEGEVDVTRRIDLIAEDKVEECLRSEGVPAWLVSEETPLKKLSEKPSVVIVLDPLDGTRNFVNAIPFYAVSLALGKFQGGRFPSTGDLVAGVVEDVPRGDVFHAVKGEGAYHNGRRVERIAREPGDKPLITLYSYGSLPNPGSLQRLLKEFKVRVLGSLALELCYVALGRLDGLIDARGRARLADFAAAKVILEEAGGSITDLRGRAIEAPLDDARGRFNLLAAGDKAIHGRLLSLLGRAAAPTPRGT